MNQDGQTNVDSPTAIHELIQILCKEVTYTVPGLLGRLMYCKGFFFVVNIQDRNTNRSLSHRELRMYLRS